MNSFSAVGRIGRDAEVRYTQSGTAMTVFPLAVDDGFGDKKVTTWIDCAMWGERGTKVAEHIRKGDQLYVKGSIRLETYTTKDGAEKSKVAMRIEDIQLLGGKREQATEQRQAPARPAPARPSAPAPLEDDGDSIPFS